MNQIMELFKMQVLMKFMNGDSMGGRSSTFGQLFTMLVLMGYDQFARQMPRFMTYLWVAIVTWWTGKEPVQSTLKEPLLLASGPPPPAAKSIRAFIQFERHPGKLSDPRIDAVIHHVCTLPDVRSLRYNGVEMIPNFKDALMIDNDVWFEISNPNTGPPVMTVGGDKDIKQEPILYRLSTYDHDITWLHKFVEQAQDNFEQEKRNKLGSETYYFDQLTSNGEFRNPMPKQFCLFTKSKFTSNRSLNNVYLKQIDELRERVEFFMRRRDWYDNKGIPHTLGIVMYGHPGCGKTSTIKAIANETKRHIFNIALSSIKTKEALKDLFYNDKVQILNNGVSESLNIPLKHRLYVIEDIDAMDSVVIKRSAKKTQEEIDQEIRVKAEMELLKQTQGEIVARNMMNGKISDEDKLDLATLLNVLDGVRETPGRIIILSTNYPERLDEALLRPGRFDMMLEFEKHSCVVIKQHLEKHYDLTLTDAQWNRINVPELNHKWTPAEVSQILFRRVNNVDLAIDDLLKEDPSKLFKFSQLNNQNYTGAKPEGDAKPEADAGMDLAALIQQEIAEEVKPEVKEEAKTIEEIHRKYPLSNPNLTEEERLVELEKEKQRTLKEFSEGKLPYQPFGSKIEPKEVPVLDAKDPEIQTKIISLVKNKPLNEVMQSLGEKNLKQINKEEQERVQNAPSEYSKLADHKNMILKKLSEGVPNQPYDGVVILPDSSNLKGDVGSGVDVSAEVYIPPKSSDMNVGQALASMMNSPMFTDTVLGGASFDNGPTDLASAY